jgi:rhodanese-related sulfurtransferase
MAGFIGSAVARGEYPQVYAEDLPALLAPVSGEPPVLLDVRTPAEFGEGAIPGAVPMPLDALRDRLAELPAGRPVIAYCAAGQRGYMATRILREAGFDAANLAGGYKTYRMVVG